MKETYMTDYGALNGALVSLIGGVDHFIANLANASALLYMTLADINWAGFYLVEDGKLVLSAFQGKPACIEIPAGRGVCGTALVRKETVVVPDVHEFPGHIACDCDSRSEIVIPLFSDGKVAGVLDIDSPVTGRFTGADREGLECFARNLEKELFGK